MGADELVEEVDPTGAVQRVVTRAEMRAGRLRHRAVYLPVLDTAGRLLVHRRALDKDVWPGRWDIAAGGVVGAGEAWQDAARRELAEELGVTGVALVHLGGGTYEDHDVRVVGEVFLVRHDGPFAFADGEVLEARFVTADELTAQRDGDARWCPDSLAIVLPLLPGAWPGSADAAPDPDL